MVLFNRKKNEQYHSKLRISYSSSQQKSHV